MVGAGVVGAGVVSAGVVGAGVVDAEVVVDNNRRLLNTVPSIPPLALCVEKSLKRGKLSD